ncbi:SCO family protein [Candidatus Marinimicrobia bacterium]|nr:SCO family protein [Candidatus Neomarinimicrobiota bacterium]
MKKKIIYLFIPLLFSCSEAYKVHEVTGVVLDIDENAKSILVDHDSISGFMMPMVMPFKIKNKNILKNIIKHDSISFDFIITERTSYAENFKKLGKSSLTFEEDEFWDEDEYQQIEIGQTLSEVNFIDTKGDLTSLNQYRDNYIFISFIFTKCPVPNMCPAVVIKNGVLARKFKDSSMLKFIMVSFDYIYDTPAVLNLHYGNIIKDYPNWMVWSSVKNTSDLYTLTSEVGVSYWGIEKNNIGHNLRSILIGPDRKLLKVWKGDEWLAGDVGKELDNYVKFMK